VNIGKPEKVVPVMIEKIVRTNLTATFTLPATLEAWEDLSLAAETAGAIRQIHYKEGDRVEQGEVLLEIDPDTIKNYLQRDQQNVLVMRKKLDRYRQLATEGLVSQQELDDIINSVTAAKTALRTTQLQLQKSFPVAPIGGVVDRLYVDRGEYVDPGKPLLRLVQTDKLKVIAAVPEKDISFLKVGQQVELIPTANNEMPAALITGKIEAIAFLANPATHTYRTKIVINNCNSQLRPGMIVRAKFIRQQLDHVISIPLYAVMDRGGKKIVYVAESGVARKIDVITGSSVGQRIVIIQGLKKNQAIIVAGQQLLVDGVRIDVGEK